MLAAFQDWAKGLEHAAPLPQVPDPDGLPRVEESFAGLEDRLQMFVQAPHPIDMRYTNDPAWILKGTGGTLDYNRVWMRADGKLPDDPLIHVAALVIRPTPRCWTRSSPRTGCRGVSTASSRPR